MFRSKKDVDRHVQSIFSKLRNENEKNLRCYNVAKLYYQVGDYESTKRYVCSYLEVRDGSASAHKLLGQAYEALGQKEAAFNEYKISLEIEGRQDDLVLKVCELLANNDIAMDVNKVNYLVDRADKQFPHHPVVFQLKEKLTKEKPNSNSEDLEKLIISELDARRTDVHLHIKLLNHYMSEQKLDKAYEHAISVEAKVCYKNSIAWYQLLCELLTKCKQTKSYDWSFWFLYITTLDRYARLCLKEQGSHIKKSVTDAAQAVFNFDQSLNEMKSKSFSKQHPFTKHLFMHMWGQLHFHLACLLLRKTKREQGSWSEAGRLCAPLLLTALHVAPLESRTCVHLENEGFKNQFKLWNKEAAYRCCQAGHILQDYAKNDTKKLIDRIDKFCTGHWRERIYQRIFVTKMYLDHIRKSFFCGDTICDPPLRFCSAGQLKSYSQIAQDMWPDSLHHQIWFGLENRSQHKDAPYPNQYSLIFPDLQFSVFNTNQAAPDSLCLLDIDAFLNAATLCSSAVLEEQQLGSFMNPEKLPTLPVDLTMTLSTSNQEKWWSAACKMYSKRENVDIGDIGELRKELQQGLEVIRCIGNHGMHPVLLVHLARMFHYRAKLKKEKDEDNSHIPRWEARSELYWTTVIPLLERLQNNQTLCMSSSKLFNYQGKEMNNFELTIALEEGKLLLAQRLVREKQYEQAIDALLALKCPEASFQQAKIYKIFADEIVNSTPRESLTSEMRSQHIIMLSKARNCFYLTLDRLRSPGMNPKHPLNSELGTYIADIENEMKRIDPEDLGRGDLSRNDIDDLSDESYSPTHSAVDQAVHINSTLPVLTTGGSNMLSTPQRNAHRTPKHASTPCKTQHQDYLNLSKNRIEVRPSPERLDAQIRQIMQSRDNEMQELTEQMKNLMDQTKSMMSQMKTLTDKVDNLTKEVTESRKENQKQQQQQQQQQRVQQQQNVNPPVDPDDFYVLDDDEYADLSYQNQPTGPASSISGNIFASQHRHPYSSLLYPSAATAFQGYYQGGIPFTDPNAQAALPPLYPPVYPMPVLYPNANQTKVPDNPLQQGLFASTLPSQLPDLMPVAAAAAAAAANPSLQIPLQPKVETPRAKVETAPTTTLIKDAPVNKTPPVNVVITTSDTLPTTVPSTQPTLSVTIPPQYRLAGGTAVTFSSSTPGTATAPTVATTAMITKAANAPHCYQIPMPSQATIPTTVNLPPTTIYVTPPVINIPPVYAGNLTFSTLSAITTTQSTAGSNAPPSVQTPEKPIYEPIESPNASTEIAGEQEHDPIPDFVPVIPLPAKVKVLTGEEDEDSLYCGRAKLFRFVDKEWKERGVGYVKLLRNAEGKVRLLMRRDQVLKICANHLLRHDMELTPMSNNNKAWCWVANDFADEAVKLEKLCIRFKTAEDATAFKQAFDQAKLGLIASPEKPSKTKDKAPSSDNKIKDPIKAQKPQPTQQANISSTTEVASSDKSKSGTTTLGGFSFSSKPIIQTVSETSDSKKCEEPPKVSPFSGFSFTKSAANNKNDAAVVNKPADSSKPPLSQLFKTPAGSWTCDECYIINSGSNIYCVACDSPKDPSQPPKPQQTSIFQLNVSGSSAATPMTTFSFGIPKDTAKETTSTGFTFRMPKADDKSTSDSTKTTLLKTEETTGTNFVFGMPIKTSQKSGESPFTFGSPTKSFGFNFTAKSPVKSPGGSGGGGGGGETSEDEVVESDDIHFSPIVPLPDKIEVKTGEENEEVIYSHRAKLFRFDTEVKEWKERGLGDIKLLRHKETGKLRLIMRRDHVLKLCLNHMLTTDLEFTPKDEKTWLWTTADYSDGEIEYMQFACRFKTAEIATNFKQTIDDARKTVRPAIASEKVNKAKTPMKTTKEIEIVYEAKVTPEEKAAALKLQLPENFYAYKQKEDCPGCIGCRKPSLVLYPDASSQETKWKPVLEEKKPSSESSQSVAQSVKNGFSFAMAPSATFKTTPVTSSIFDGSTMSFGTGDLKLFNDKKTTTFSFGMNPQFGANEATENTTGASLENVKICSPSNAQVTQTTASNTTDTTGSIFNQATASVFKTSNFTFDSSKNIFGGASKASDSALPKTSIFGESGDGNSLSFGNSTASFNTTKTTSAAAVTPNSVPRTSLLTMSSTLGPGSFQFGIAPTQRTSKANDTAAASTIAFDASNQSSNSVFATSSTPFSKMTFGNTTSPFGDSTTTTNIFGTTATTNIFAKPSDEQKSEDNTSFLVEDTISFAAIAKIAAEKAIKPSEAFKIDPNFKFAGAGSSVFGSKPVLSSSSLNSSGTVQNRSHNESVQKEDNEEDEGEVDNEQEHDPHFEPIIPLPDAIEVRTGEEDEEKVFYHRAKLYRYDNATKEWKERGIGEMKILYHAGHGSYRLLLRREQVHKVVCNFLITHDVEFHPLSTSDQAWMWAGVNYADQEPCAEQLAVKFKSSDLARQFKAHIDAIQQELRGKKSVQDERYISEVHESEEHDQSNDVDEEEEDEEEEDDEDDQEMLPIIEKPATVFARLLHDEPNKWQAVGSGNLAIYYDSEIYAERIVLKLDDSEEYASNTIISMDTLMQVEGKECIWSGIDYASEPPVRRVLRAVFSSIEAAQEMHTFYEDALDSAKQAGVVEYQDE
ncbi:E3 SUMO-protein ligase RanBP2 [Linepithema humile]|uniref:E3 SUMO-protein ligase RanBP2 n=1 Tax=Linepithema humile TaxID=83485 RepID=UPI000622FEED|nr:PREDICTED: RANBP2-like and GRIP domain-containing protein 5/6 [Linepithema humile]